MAYRGSEEDRAPVEVLTDDVAFSLLASLEDPDAVTLVGSGVSSFAPSGIPSGRVFSGEMLDALAEAGRMTPQRLDQLRPFLTRIPFEVWLHYGCATAGRSQIRALAESLATSDAPNPIHRFFAERLLNGAVLITTNYDTLIEQALLHAPYTKQGQIDEGLRAMGVLRCNDGSLAPAFGTGYLFKVHGSVDAPESLVYELAQEGRVPEPTAKRLADFVRNRHLICVGYGGWGFDVLPELVRSSPQRVSWITASLDAVSPEARELVERTGGNVLVGDMQRIFALRGPPPVQVPIARQVRRSNELIAPIDEASRGLWLGVCLARLGLGADASRSLAGCESVRKGQLAVRHRELGSADYHQGKYLLSAGAWRLRARPRVCQLGRLRYRHGRQLADRSIRSAATAPRSRRIVDHVALLRLAPRLERVPGQPCPGKRPSRGSVQVSVAQPKSDSKFALRSSTGCADKIRG